MQDITKAEGDNGNEGFKDHWAEFAREETGQGDEPPREPERHEPPAEKPEGQDEESPQGEAAAPEQPAPSEAPEDIWADADPKLRAAYEAERERASKAENVLRSNSGRLSRVERELNEFRLRAKGEKPEDKPEASGKPEVTEVKDEDLQRLREEFPEVAGPLLDVISGLRSKVESLSTDADKRQELDQARNELELNEFLAGEEQKLAEKHGDWNDVVKTDEFASWALTQPRMIQEALRRNGNGIVDAEEAIEIIDRFKAATNEDAPDPLAQKRERQLEGGRSVPARTGTAPPAGKPDDYSSEWKRLAAEERRKASR